MNEEPKKPNNRLRITLTFGVVIVLFLACWVYANYDRNPNPPRTHQPYFAKLMHSSGTDIGDNLGLARHIMEPVSFKMLDAGDCGYVFTVSDIRSLYDGDITNGRQIIIDAYRPTKSKPDFRLMFVVENFVYSGEQTDVVFYEFRNADGSEWEGERPMSNNQLKKLAEKMVNRLVGLALWFEKNSEIRDKGKKSLFHLLSLIRNASMFYTDGLMRFKKTEGRISGEKFPFGTYLLTYKSSLYPGVSYNIECKFKDENFTDWVKVGIIHPSERLDFDTHEWAIKPLKGTRFKHIVPGKPVPENSMRTLSMVYEALYLSNDAVWKKLNPPPNQSHR